MNDSKTLEDQIKYIWNNIKGFHVIHFIYTGYELDLFNTIEKSGKYGLSAKELSVQKTINLYYIEKWCLSGVAWNILIEEANKYKLAPHMEYILNRPGDPRYLLPYVKSCIDHFGPDMKNHSTYYANGKKYTFQDHGIDFSKDIGNITEGLQTLLTHKILPNISSLNDLFNSKCKVLDFGCGTAKLLIKLSDPPRSNRFITNTNATTLPLETSTNFAAASAVPPVAIKSSIIKTLSSLLKESL